MRYLIRYGEIALKGKNRIDFEKQLMKNIKVAIKNLGGKFNIQRLPGRMMLESDKDPLSKTFGITSYSPIISVKPTIEEIKKATDISFILNKNALKAKTFRVSSHRADKSIKLNSNMINIEIGSHVAEKYNKKVNLQNYDLEVGIDIFNSEAHIYTKKLNGPGGLPVGSTGRAVLLLDSKDAVKAGIMIMKRGTRLVVMKKKDIDIAEIIEYNSFQPPKFIYYSEDFQKILNNNHCSALIVDSVEKINNRVFSLTPIIKNGKKNQCRA